MTPIREDKPTWSSVPATVKAGAEAILGSRVVRAVRAFGGYGPSATFVLALDDGRRAFFKGVYPLPEGSAVKWRNDEEERVYQELAELITPWAPTFYGSVRTDGWHVLLMEAGVGQKVPPWTGALARNAIRSYAEFHASTAKAQLPEWLPREHHLEFTGFWAGFNAESDLRSRLAAMCTTADASRRASDWLAAYWPALAAAEAPLAAARSLALLPFDTRSDNIRIDGERLRMFDWPFACAGPPEFDFGAFAQSVALEGGPSAEDLAAAYAAVRPVDDELLTASIVGFAGYFADRGSRPDLPGLPRLRAFQRRQLKSSLGWAA